MILVRKGAYFCQLLITSLLDVQTEPSGAWRIPYSKLSIPVVTCRCKEISLTGCCLIWVLGLLHLKFCQDGSVSSQRGMAGGHAHGFQLGIEPQRPLNVSFRVEFHLLGLFTCQTEEYLQILRRQCCLWAGGHACGFQLGASPRGPANASPLICPWIPTGIPATVHTGGGLV